MAVVIPDAGPLISLGVADRLDVLLLLKLPIILVDHVFWEVTNDEDLPGAGAVARLVREHGDVVTVFETFVGRAAREARQRDPRAPLRGLGEAAVAELYSRLDEVVDPLDPVLIVFEDSDVRRISAIVRGNVHLVSTRALLVGMERRGLIASADAVWESIHGAGRNPSSAEVDRPAPPPYGKSKW